jgi:diaminopimelate epimerase
VTFFLQINISEMTEFFKYQGTGNDFVMIDNRQGLINLTTEDIEKVCHRRFGVGADGLIMIENIEGYDFKMKYYNADGREGSMCGNGGRCAVQFASDLKIFKNKTSFLAVDGPHDSEINDGLVFLNMIDVESIKEEDEGYFLNTGSPQLIVLVENIGTIDVKTTGAAIRYSEKWTARGGVNVNFVEILDSGHIKVRTYERGVEDETYSCGTGVTAAAIVSNHIKNCFEKVNITTLGGDLKVSFSKSNPSDYTNIHLIGPAKFVFKGYL